MAFAFSVSQSPGGKPTAEWEAEDVRKGLLSIADQQAAREAHAHLGPATALERLGASYFWLCAVLGLSHVCQC